MTVSTLPNPAVKHVKKIIASFHKLNSQYVAIVSFKKQSALTSFPTPRRLTLRGVSWVGHAWLQSDLDPTLPSILQGQCAKIITSFPLDRKGTLQLKPTSFEASLFLKG